MAYLNQHPYIKKGRNFGSFINLHHETSKIFSRIKYPQKIKDYITSHHLQSHKQKDSQTGNPISQSPAHPSIDRSLQNLLLDLMTRCFATLSRSRRQLIIFYQVVLRSEFQSTVSELRFI